MGRKKMVSAFENASSVKVFMVLEPGPAKEIELHEVQKYREQAKLIWVCIESKQPAKFLHQLPELSEVVMEFLSAAKSRPRSFIYNESLLASFRGVNLNPNSEPEDMISIRVCISSKIVITTQGRQLASVQGLKKDLVSDTAPQSPAEFLVELLDNLTDNTIQIISTIDAQVDALEDEVGDNEHNKIRKDLALVRRRIVMLRRYLVPQREALSRLHSDKLPWISDSLKMLLREIVESCMKQIEDLDTARERCTILNEELMRMAQEQINQKMYVLSLIAMIFMPLSFIAGLLGVNVGGIPLAGNKFGFSIVVSGMFLLAFAEFLYLRHKKWI